MEEDAYFADATCAPLLAVAIGERKFEGISLVRMRGLEPPQPCDY